MPFYSGNSGGIQFGKAGVVDGSADNEKGSGWKTTDTKVTSWTLSTTAQLLNTTTLGDYDKSSVYGPRTTTGTLKLFYYTDFAVTEPGSNASPENNSASWFLHALLRATTKSQSDSYLPPNLIADESITCYLRLFIDDKSQPGNVKDFIDLAANLTSINFGSNVGELVALDVAFEATGQPLINRA